MPEQSSSPRVVGRRPSQVDSPTRTSSFFGTRKPWQSSGLLLQTRSGGLLLAKRMRNEPLTTREGLFLLMNEPSTSREAFIMGRSLQGLLVLSAIASIWETVTSVTSGTGPEIWVALKYLFNVIFTIEMLLRLVTYVPYSAAPYDAYVWLDILQTWGFWVRLRPHLRRNAQTAA